MPPRLSLFLAATLLCVACENKTQKNQASLLGRWEMAEAFRNQKATQLLAGVYFDFGADGKMTTNLPTTAEGATEYVVEKDNITQKTTLPIVYHIAHLSETELVLEVELRNVPFELRLRRAPAAEPPFDTLQGRGDSLAE
jgi:hypothetical protein